MSRPATLVVRILIVAVSVLAWSAPPAWSDATSPAGASVPTAAGVLVSTVLSAALGDPDTELVFTPLAPCRLIDTRLAGGPFAAGETRSYDLIGPVDYSPIGGHPLGCGLPGILQDGALRFNAARALVVNIVAVGPTGPGDLRAYPSNENVPNASVINYASVPGAGLNIANGIVLKTCAAICSEPGCEPCASGDLSVVADAAGTHLVVDVVGFFGPATRSGVSEASVQGGGSITPDCKAFASCSVFNAASSTRDVIVMSTVVADLGHIMGASDTARFNISETSGACDVGFPTQPGTSEVEIGANQSSTTAFPMSVPVLKRLPLGRETAQTYYLNGFMWNGSASYSVRTVMMECFIP